MGLSQEFGSDVDPPQDLRTLRSRASLLRVVQSAAQELPSSEILGVSAHRWGQGQVLRVTGLESLEVGPGNPQAHRRPGGPDGR